MEAQRHGEQESSYSILLFPAARLPLSYKSFVLAKWKRTLRVGNDYFKLIDSDAFFNAYNHYCTLLLARPNCTIRLAVLSDTPDVALGWSLIEGNTLHYVYVQSEQRNKGIAKSLVPVPIDCITHLTKSGLSIWHSKMPHAKFNPFK